MHDRTAWSLSLGSWLGVHVRLHMFFVLFAAFVLLLNWRYADARAFPQVDGALWLGLLTLLVSVAVHEAGHAVFARRYGVRVEQVVLGPLGGMTPLHVADDPRLELGIHLAGPAANLVLGVLCVPGLLILDVDIWGLLNPFAPADLTIGSAAEVLLKLAFWVNWCLLLINLLPAFPLDGAYALRAAILGYWPRMDPRRASEVTVRVAQTLACGLLIASLLWRFEDGRLLLPVRSAMILLSIFLFFSARQRPRESDEQEEVEGLEFSGNLAALEQDLEASDVTAPGPLRRWLDQRRESRQRRQHELELEEEQQVDEILARLHEQGMDSLTSDDRALLERVSARYRSRLRT